MCSGSMGKISQQTVEVPLLTGIDDWSVDDVVSLFKKCKFTSAGVGQILCTCRVL